MDVVVHAASPPDEPLYNWRSASDTPRCSLFAYALLHEWSTSPEGQIRCHMTLIRKEIGMVGQGQQMSASTAEVSRRTFWDHNISHFKFIPTPSIAGIVRQAVGEQQRHEERLTAWSSARTFWRLLLRQPHPNPPAANEDIALQIVRRHLDDMGGAAYSATQSGLTISCRMVLKGEAIRHLCGLVLETIA